MPCWRNTTNRETLRSRASCGANMPTYITALLALPGLSVPASIKNDVPTSVQLVAARYQDPFLFDAN